MTGVPGRVLVVDDEENVRNLLQRILKEAGYDVTVAVDGEHAIGILYQEEHEVVILDIKMPGLTGIEVLGKITDEWPDTCVIMLTAVIDAQTAVKAMKLGALDYITKPFNQGDVVQKVGEAIAKWEQKLKDRHQYLELKEKFREQTQRMQTQFNELVNSLAREHNLMYELSTRQGKGGQASLSELPPELQKPIASVDEFRDALLKILRRT
ncbi:MAG: response regulator [Dehalococcoidales bacterium]